MRKRLLFAPVATGAMLVAGGGFALAQLGASPASAAQVHVVKFGEYFYRPKRLTIHVGDRVRFVNIGKIQHTVADSTKSGTIRSKLIKPRPLSHGKSQTVTFHSKGTVYYLCTFHPQLMRGTIVVR
ncbi:MAG TPA: plastocyanin/azurin family copper-binding protein [Solirubrobacteraceae bacterium]|jgi:plastocyanin|nr:plastocyanin/azurin family copper-binding protein [Solirubrobacteraceae bacterium]